VNSYIALSYWDLAAGSTAPSMCPAASTPTAWQIYLDTGRYAADTHPAEQSRADPGAPPASPAQGGRVRFLSAGGSELDRRCLRDQAGSLAAAPARPMHDSLGRLSAPASTPAKLLRPVHQAPPAPTEPHPAVACGCETEPIR
jgi:hypothetical protein